MLPSHGMQQQSKTLAVTDTDGLQPSDSTLDVQSQERGSQPAKMKRPAKANAEGKSRKNKKDSVNQRAEQR
ncbi:hypothetical protein NDU88_001203 [Pleurodeles waltl]|uniref:Uncharacterized protein n=1 Tax=Pleurodeles waltl TaxID=8319 RepID=A0AAV7MJU7_PLEWA|nr:hypothetical protein NDU88_001203 [Pleurodeles waltl]